MNGVSVRIDQPEKDGEETEAQKMDLPQNQTIVCKARQLCQSTLSGLTCFEIFFCHNSRTDKNV